jgi:hypothetical protein
LFPQLLLHVPHVEKAGLQQEQAYIHMQNNLLSQSVNKLTLQWMSSAQPMQNFHGDSFPSPPVRRTQKPNPNRLQNPLLKNSGKKAKNARKHCTQIDTQQT